MKGFTRRLALALAIAAMLVAGCTSQTKDDGGTSAGSGSDSGSSDSSSAGLAANNQSAGSTIGITDDTIKVAFIGVDFGALKSSGLVPELGDQEKQVTSLVEEINENGGIAGRKIDLHFKLLDFLAGGQDAIQAACIEATQDVKAAVVVLPPASPRLLASCTAVTNKTLTIHAIGFDQALFEESQGRLFAPGGMSTDRQFAGWVQQMDELGVLKDKTIGVVGGDQPEEFLNPIKTALIPALEDGGHAVAQNITLPCSGGGTTCEQYDAAAQKLKDAGVDTVFMTLANTFGPPLIQAAANIGYHPQWLIEGNQATNTVLQFYESVKQDLDGAIGVGFSFALPEDITDEATRCNKIVTERSGEEYEPGSDAFGFTSSLCTVFRVLQDGAATVDAGELTQGAIIDGIASLGSFPATAGPDGTLTPTKHDGLDHLFLCDFDAEVGECVRRDTTPFEVAS